MSENQSVCFFSMIEHAIVPVRAIKFVEVETGLRKAPAVGLGYPASRGLAELDFEERETLVKSRSSFVLLGKSLSYLYFVGVSYSKICKRMKLFLKQLKLK